MSEEKYIDRARYLIAKKYVVGIKVDELADKLHKQDIEKVEVPEGVMSRETVYGKENVEVVQRIVDTTAAHQKQLISPGERTSAALQDKELDVI